jgi:predicted nucleotidyltransferase
MECAEAMAALKAHEAELKRLGVEHLYLFGSTARGEARVTSDVDLFFDHERGKLGVYELMDVKAAATPGAVCIGCYAIRSRPRPCRYSDGYESPIPRLIDIIEAAELIYSELNGVTLDEFESDRRKADRARYGNHLRACGP